jgi:TP901 family phage tail tape measure protein
MKSALGEINKNQDMNRLAADLAMASSLTQPFRDGLSSLMGEPSRLAGTFESSMKNIQAITGRSASEIGTLRGELLKIGGEHAAGPLAVADAYGDVAGGITNFAAQLPVLNASLALAEAGQADLGTAANGLVKILNSYNFSAGDAASVTEKAAWASDVMTQAVGMGVGSMQEFVSAMAPISGAAASVGIGFDEIGSTMAYMTATTDTAATAGTKLESFMTALQKPSDMLSKALKSVGIESGSEMLKLYGLGESAKIVSSLFGGSSDLITQALGRQEAKAAVISLMSDQYSTFASEFGAAMQNTVTAEAAAIQNQSYESKLGRLQAAQDALSVGIGQDINAIKGFFADMGSFFLTHVAAPIMASPVGEVFQGIAAGAGLAAKTVLDMGSGALNTATQLVLLTATVENAGGFSKLFGNALGGIASPLKNIGQSIAGTVGPLIAKTTATFAATAAEAGFAGALWATAGAMWAAVWPVLAVAAGVAALAFGGYMLIKHWDAVSAFFVNLWNKITGAFSAAFDWIKNLLGGVSNNVLGAVAVFLPFIGIPALVIKNWETIQAFFAGLWARTTALFTTVWTGIKNFFAGLWAGIASALAGAWNGVFSFFTGLWVRVTALVTAVWTGIKNFFAGLWTGIASALAGAWNGVFSFFAGLWGRVTALVTTVWTGIKNFFAGLWAGIASALASAWNGILAFFNSVWNGITQTVAAAASWLSGVWDTVAGGFAAAWNGILAFFNSVWNGITQTVAAAANWFSGVWDTVAGGFAGAWLWIKDLFVSVWESIKGVVTGFVEWLSPVIDAIIKPFKDIGNAIGGIAGAVGGWFGETVEIGRTELARRGENKTGAAAKPVETADSLAAASGSNAAGGIIGAIGGWFSRTAELGRTELAKAGENKTKSAAAKPVETANSLAVAEPVPASEIVPPALFTASSAATPPAFTSAQTATGTGADAAGGAGKSLLNEHLAAASRKGIADTDMSLAASGAFMDAGASVVPVIEIPDFDREARTNFQEAMPAQSAAFQPPRNRSETKPAKSEPRTVKIENLYLQADDTLDLLNFVRQLEHAVLQPVEIAI